MIEDEAHTQSVMMQSRPKLAKILEDILETAPPKTEPVQKLIMWLHEASAAFIESQPDHISRQDFIFALRAVVYSIYSHEEVNEVPN